jgi:hypothetical protein
MGLPSKGKPVKYEVIVSDLGTMYQGADCSEALRIYEDYVLRSIKPYVLFPGRTRLCACAFKAFVPEDSVFRA